MNILLNLSRIVIVVALVLCALSDVKSRIIPTRMLVVACGAWIVSAVISLNGNGFETFLFVAIRCLEALLCVGVCLIVCAVYEFIFKKPSMGGGDVKLFGLMFVLLGGEQGLIAMAVACVLGVLHARVRYAGEASFPFGPAIVVSTIVFLGLQWM